jgi:hypothetical protein
MNTKTNKKTNKVHKDLVVTMQGSRFPDNKIILIQEITQEVKRFFITKKVLKKTIKEINPNKVNYTTKDGCRVFF